MDSQLGRLRRARRAVRRAVLARRRLLAALLVGVAVLAGLRATMPPPPPTTQVTVAARDLAAGVVLGESDVVSVDYPPDRAPQRIAEDVVGRRLAAPLRQGEPVTDVRLVGPALVAAYPGLVAVPVRLPDSAAVGLLAAGDRIDVYAAAPRRGGARLVAAAATVVTVPASAAEPDSGPLSGRLVVLAVPAATVGALADAAVQDFLSFAFAG